ncbi:tetraspanin-8-like isoform X2 [Abrus precatorius]|uniref:Tetraspanin-8-like isoform X2 n=1 Tax=Abrus precatorius TaxID=3816 RepID=A0A8B8JVE4_ABRPR|nr:tetraspanin-8-like isoform X2 [Abrus precatorius]
MVRVSNNLIGLLNFLTLLLSIPILITGVWLSKQVNTDCERWLERPFIVLGVFLLLVSLAGLVGACCRVSWLLWLYLFVMFLLIIVVFAFTIFTFVVTNKGAGEAISNRGYKEYRLGDYSNWLQKRVNNSHNWNRIRSCLQSGKLCSQFQAQFANDTDQQFYAENLSALQNEKFCKGKNVLIARIKLVGMRGVRVILYSIFSRIEYFPIHFVNFLRCHGCMLVL